MEQSNKKLVAGWRVAGSWIFVIILIMWLVWRFANHRSPSFFEFMIPSISLMDAISITTKYTKEDEERRRRANSHIETDGRLPWESKKD